MIAALLWACAAPSTPMQDEARQFVALLQSGDPAGCAQLADPELRGQCENANGLPCAQIIAGPWQQECYFSRAEAALARGDHERALSDCRQSGNFESECFTHLFKAQLEPKLDPLEGDFSFVELTAEAQALAASYGDWSPPWGWWWRRLHAESSPIDRARCEPFPPQERRSCQREARASLQIAWRDALPLRERELCGLSDAELRAAVATDARLSWRESADMDDAVHEELQRACR